MQRYKLARVRWHVGQTLLPQHFHAQEAALEAEIRLHASLSGTPGHGFATLAWNESLLLEGSLSISSMSVVTRSGIVIDVPGNATLPPFSLEGTGKSEVIVHLHVLRETTNAEGVRLYADDPPVLQRVLHKLQLSSEPVFDGAVDTLPLAMMTRDDEGKWSAVRDWIPPLLLVGPNPFLDGLLAELEPFLDLVRQQLLTRISDTYVRSDRLNNARRALFEVYRLQAMLGDMQRQVYPHPYQLFDALRRLYFEACCYLEMLPDEQMPVYQHDDLGKSLGSWMLLLTRSFQPEATRSTHKPFTYKDGLFICSPLPPEVRAANELYLLVHRGKGNERLSLEGVKLAGPSRLPTVRRVALKGIPYTHVPYPSFPHALGPEIDWYQLTPGEEWQQALREDGMAFYVTPALKGAHVSLFWRKT
ncbi:MAG TPA: type VI secretion system baseplate subunit TssK [Myxococcaceae bacterium]|jgi:type VI secretion system protein ImpJ